MRPRTRAHCPGTAQRRRVGLSPADRDAVGKEPSNFWSLVCQLGSNRGTEAVQADMLPKVSPDEVDEIFDRLESSLTDAAQELAVDR